MADGPTWPARLAEALSEGLPGPVVSERLDVLLRWMADPQGADARALADAIRQRGLQPDDARQAAFALLDHVLFAADDAEPHRLLGLRPGTDPKTVQARYHRLVQLYHPDRNEGDRRWLNERTERLNRAYSRLKRSGAPEAVAAASPPRPAGVHVTAAYPRTAYPREAVNIRRHLGSARQLRRRILVGLGLGSLAVLGYLYFVNAPYRQPPQADGSPSQAIDGEGSSVVAAGDAPAESAPMPNATGMDSQQPDEAIPDPFPDRSAAQGGPPGSSAPATEGGEGPTAGGDVGAGQVASADTADSGADVPRTTVGPVPERDTGEVPPASVETPPAVQEIQARESSRAAATPPASGSVTDEVRTGEAEPAPAAARPPVGEVRRAQEPARQEPARPASASREDESRTGQTERAPAAAKPPAKAIETPPAPPKPPSGATRIASAPAAEGDMKRQAGAAAAHAKPAAAAEAPKRAAPVIPVLTPAMRRQAEGVVDAYADAFETGDPQAFARLFTQPVRLAGSEQDAAAAAAALTASLHNSVRRSMETAAMQFTALQDSAAKATVSYEERVMYADGRGSAARGTLVLTLAPRDGVLRIAAVEHRDVERRAAGAVDRIRALLDRYCEVYAAGDLREFVALFTTDGIDNKVHGRAGLHDEYRTLFDSTRARALRLDIGDVATADGERFRVQGSYTVSLEYRNGRTFDASAPIRIVVVKRAGELKIERMEY